MRHLKTITHRYGLSWQGLLLTCCLWLCVCMAQAATYSSAATTFSWIDPSTHTDVTWTHGASCSSSYASAPVDDDISAQLPLGFTFNFGGVDYTTVQIMSNGRLQFNNGYCGYGTQSVGPPRKYTVPIPNASMVRTMKVYAADFDPGAGGTVRYAALGSAPNRSFVVTWSNVPEWNSPAWNCTKSCFNIQVILHENGDFDYQFGNSVNASNGHADIGWELTTGDYDLYSYSNIGALANTAIRFFIPAGIAEYRMEEASWSGAGDVSDSTGNGNNGTAVGAAQTIAGGYLCRGADIPANTGKNTVDAIDTGIVVDNALSAAGAVTFWYKGAAAWNDGNDRMLLDATSNNSAPFFLSKRSDGRLRFVLQDNNNKIFVDETGTHNFAANGWHHIAITWGLGNSGHMTVYIDGTVSKQVSVNAAATLDIKGGTLYIGDNQGKATSNNPTDNSANGVIDEVRVYNYEIPSSVVNRDYLLTRSCSSLDHFAISYGAASASTCTAKNISITAKDALNNTLTGYTGTVNLSTSTSHGNWSKVSATGVLSQGIADSGAAGYSFAAADNGTITLALGNSHADDLTLTVSDPSAAVSAATPTLSFRDNVFVITPTDALGTTVVAARPHAIKAELWRKDPSTGNCSIATEYAGIKPLKTWLTRDAADPGGAAPTITSVAPPTLATASLPNAQPGAANVSLNFTAGVANFTLGSGDVGKYALNLLDDTRAFATGVDIPGGSGTLTVRPFGLAFSNIKKGAISNPGGANPTDAVFTAAGQAFQATVGAYLWQAADDTNNDGVPDAGAVITDNGLATKFAWPVTLNPAINTPAGGILGSVDGTNPITQTSFSGGSATVNDLTYNEVGSMTLTASAGDYLNSSGVNTSGSSGIIGRFTPDHFAVSYNTPEFATGCAAGAFTYLGQVFNFTAGKAPVMTVSARSASAGTPITKNYSGPFWKLTNSTLANRFYSAASGTLDLSNLPPSTSDPVIVDTGNGVFSSAGSGTGTLTFSVGTGLSFQRLLTAPFAADISLGIDVIDGDGIALTGTTAAFGTASPGNGIAFSSGKDMRFGRLALQNAYGSELLDLPINLTAEYYADLDGAGPGTDLGFITNTADICTTVTAGDVTVTPNAPLLAGDTTLTVASPILVNGSWHTSASGPYSHLSPPASGQQGSVDLLVDLDAAGIPWLKYDWDGVDQLLDGNLLDDNPSARAVFGIYQGPDRRIYMHERFN